MFIRNRSQNEGLAVTALLLALALSSIVAIGVATYYKETRSAELNVDKTTYLQSIEAKQSVNEFPSTPVSVPLPKMDGGVPPVKFPNIVSLAGVVKISTDGFTNSNSSSFNSIKNRNSDVNVVGGGNNGTVVSGNVNHPSAGTPIPAVGNATIVSVTPPPPIWDNTYFVDIKLTSDPDPITGREFLH